ncbi:Trypsin-like serine protease [Nitrospira sp. KM1]|uniref:S1C family serine protease n=1 Tax=Nitrospira sp. KM1 TaxID=1936990 RepID=UPI0013A72DEA|nr:serine protease [Nitrospira sp. KM1]BCA54454.1 Trypsin-like serine protease [Nitrospira sp. KM1]
MKLGLSWAIALLLVGSFPSDVFAKELSPREIYEQDSPAVVMVMGYPDGGRRGSAGTGTIIRADGYVLTNAHVVIDEQTTKPFPRLSVFLKPARVTGDHNTDLSRMVRARVVSFSQPLDLALLKLDGVMQPLPVVQLSESEQSRIGDRVVAIGHPEQGGLWTLTTGVISAEVDNFNGVKGKNVFQTETGLNRGNSGGPLLDSEGHMVGVNTAIARIAPDGLPIASISFSLKSSVAASWMQQQGVDSPSVKVGPASPAHTHASGEPPISTRAIPRPPTGPTAKPDQSPNGQGDILQKQDVKELGPPRPYNLDRLINDRAKAEADLEEMMYEMRGRMKDR